MQSISQGSLLSAMILFANYLKRWNVDIKTLSFRLSDAKRFSLDLFTIAFSRPLEDLWKWNYITFHRKFCNIRSANLENSCHHARKCGLFRDIIIIIIVVTWQILTGDNEVVLWKEFLGCDYDWNVILNKAIDLPAILIVHGKGKVEPEPELNWFL